jgi:hypothetical protein
MSTPLNNIPSSPLAGTTPAALQHLSPHAQGASGFGEFLRSAQSQLEAPKEKIQVRSGDTLIGMAKRQAAQSGRALSDNEAMRVALQTAKSNGIRNPNLIFPGQSVEFTTPLRHTAAAATTGLELSTQERLLTRQSTQTHAVLNRTLERAVDKGYLSRAEQPRVYERILKLADDFNFDPDDFAHIAMMESDGLNPKATNGRCHGIIQFCEGPGRGAASVDKLGQAASIRNMGVLDQLELVDKYFKDVGLVTGGQRKVQLDDLYLSVLTPAARAYREPNQSLPIPGVQAAALHIDGQRHRPITRTSIVSGLIQNSQNRLGDRLDIDHRRQIGQLNLPLGPERNLTGAMAAAATQRQDLAVRSTASIGKSPESGSNTASKEEI